MHAHLARMESAASERARKGRADEKIGEAAGLHRARVWEAGVKALLNKPQDSLHNQQEQLKSVGYEKSMLR